ncbi:MAG: AI-2E family transporter [Patescibacteria group bacterium]
MKSNTVISISTGTFLKAVGIILVLGFLWYIKNIVAICLVSVLLATLIEPFAEWFAKRNIPRSISVLIVYIVLLSFITLISVGIVPVITDQFVQLTANSATFTTDFFAAFSRVQSFSVQHGFSENMINSLQSLQEGFSQSIGSVFTTVKGFFGGLATMLIIFVLTFYMVAEGEKMQKYFKSLAPVYYQPYLSEMTKKIQIKIGAWLRGQLLLGFIIGLASFIILSILGVRYALLLAIIAGFCEMIPYVGPIFAAIPAIIIAFVQSPILAIMVLVSYLVIQQIENHLLVPTVMQKVTGLNLIVSIIALLVGVKIGGILGAFFAIPLATMLMVILDDTFKAYQ